MALDKQKILNELGSVVNQLQSAECGCMGKMFSNSGQGSTMGSPLPTCGGCRRSCCQGHGYNHNYSACAGEPFSSKEQCRNAPCMGFCNPPKLYADTYKYLNHNLMQPVIQEVYNDLKNINPNNTVSNNPMAHQLGLSPGNAPSQGNSPNTGLDTSGYGMGQSTINNDMNQPLGNTNQQMVNMNSMKEMNAMGANILKMMSEGGSGSKTGAYPPGGYIQGTTGPGTHDSGMAVGYSHGIANNGALPHRTNQYITQPNLYDTTNMQGDVMRPNTQPNPMQASAMIPNLPQHNTNSSPWPSGQMNEKVATQQMATVNNPAMYGQHTQGVSKFNEMFPGVMNTDLGFDPMAIAIQMNPDNHRKAAFSSIKQLMSGNLKSPNINAANIAVNQPQQVVSAQMAAQPLERHEGAATSQVFNQMQPTPQQVYTVGNETTALNQQIPIQQYQKQQQITNHNTGAVITPPIPASNYEETADPITQIQQMPPQAQAFPLPPQTVPPAVAKEPIFPVDTSKNPNIMSYKHHEYNTLGQPVEMLPAKMFHTNVPALPQTLSPQPAPTKLKAEPMAYSNVKNTISKTSIMGYKPVGKGPSRSQLQHIYNQYKGSHSYTQQNVDNPQVLTHSDRKLNINRGNVNDTIQGPVEKIGGDTIANNALLSNQIPNNAEQMKRIGDVPTPNMPYGDGLVNKEPSPNLGKGRNGLQDLVHTPYQGSAAWSFHGRNTLPISVGYQFRNRH